MESLTPQIVLTQHDLAPLPLDAPLSANPAAVYLMGLRQASRRKMRQALGALADLLYPERWTRPPRTASPQAREAYQNRALAVPWARLQAGHVNALKAALLDATSPRTSKPLSPSWVNLCLSALRGVLKQAWRLGQLDGDSYQRLTDIKGPQAGRVDKGRVLTPGELQALLLDCANDPTAAGVRDAAMLAVLWSCGLRRAELVGLDLADYDRASRRILVRGKGDKERWVYPDGGTLLTLADWLTLRGDEPGALFWAIRRGGHIQQGQRLTTQAVYIILQARAEGARIGDVTPHDFRRTFVSTLLDRGADLSAVQQLAGHKDIKTTARYDQRGEESKRQAASLLHVPYLARVLPLPQGQDIA